MNNLLIKLVLFGLLLMLVVAPFAGLAPLMLVLLGFGIFWMGWSVLEAFFTGNVEGEKNKAEFEPSSGQASNVKR